MENNSDKLNNKSKYSARPKLPSIKKLILNPVSKYIASPLKKIFREFTVKNYLVLFLVLFVIMGISVAIVTGLYNYFY